MLQVPARADAGRTGRAGAGGVAITLVTNLEKRALIGIAARYKIDFIERMAPTDEDVANIVSQRLTAHLEAQLRERDKLKTERMQRFQPLVQELAASDQGHTFLSMLLDDEYHQAIHGKVEPSVEAKRPPRSPRPNNKQAGRSNQGNRRPKR